MRIGSLCSGYGGLDLAGEQLTGGTTAWVADIDPRASVVLAHRFADAPNLGDLRAVDWSTVEPVDVLTAGYPCQPFSTAGHRKGADDPRHLWPEVLRAVRDLRPRLVLLENVAGHLSLGFGRVLGDLAAAGFNAEWTVFRASDVGAPHRRARLFIAAHPNGEGRKSRAGLPAADERSRLVRGALLAADANHDRLQGRPEQHSEPPSGRLAERQHRRHPVRCGVENGGPLGPYQPAVDRWAAITGRPAPNPLDDGKLSARFVEWMMGLSDGWVTDLLPRRQALHVLGNGVVPQQALAAFRSLLA